MAEAEQAERDRLVAALEASGYVVSHAAAQLGLSEATARRRVTTLGLDAWLEQHSRRHRRRRENRAYPPAPHEVSRQAQDQRANRESGLCACGKPPAPLPDGSPGRMCAVCRGRARRQKQGRAAATGSTARE